MKLVAVLVAIIAGDWWVHNPPGMWATDDKGQWHEFTIMDNDGYCHDDFGSQWKCAQRVLNADDFLE